MGRRLRRLDDRDHGRGVLGYGEEVAAVTDYEDEYETEEQAAARYAARVGEPAVTSTELTVEVRYGAYNDPEFWEPLFTSGEVHESLRFQVDNPLFEGGLRSTVKFADLRNDERARQGKMDKYGPVKVMTWTVTTTKRTEVSYDELDRARGR